MFLGRFLPHQKCPFPLEVFAGKYGQYLIYRIHLCEKETIVAKICKERNSEMKINVVKCNSIGEYSAISPEPVTRP